VPVGEVGVQAKRLRRTQLVVAAILLALSLVSKMKVGFIELAGGPTLAAVAALVLLWPLLHQLALRGGSTEFMGLKLQINSLEKKTEGELEVRIAELRADLESIRAAIQGGLPASAEAVPKDTLTEMLERTFWHAVAIYDEHRNLGDWSFRAEADKRLAAAAGVFSAEFLKKALADNPDDQGVAMAVAVALGAREPQEATETAELLVELLTNDLERVRYRVARSIERRASRADMTLQEYEILRRGLVQRLAKERSEVVEEAMKSALEALKVNPYARSGG
jgi:hypothetical protein